MLSKIHYSFGYVMYAARNIKNALAILAISVKNAKTLKNAEEPTPSFENTTINTDTHITVKITEKITNLPQSPKLP